MRKNLVLSRVGANSLHESWIQASTDRNWDLYLSPYQPIQAESGAQYVVGDVVPGPKWSGVREVLNGWSGWRDYDHVWLPDDDILTTGQSINQLFEVADAVGLQLFAPALDSGSHFAHFITMQNPNFFGRWVGFVEIMVPGFSRSALEMLLPTLEETETGWGWGLDSVWPKLLGYQDVGIIDGVTVTHTRPVGQVRDEALRQRLIEESDQLLARYDCRQVHATFAAFGADSKPLELTPERLLVDLVNGSQYLIDRDPRVLAWICAEQTQQFTWPAYPVEGTPS